MRITGGLARGIKLKTPAGGKVRPATDAMRESVLSSIGALINNAHVLDLFAGTGAYGLEALSRGAKHCSFIEKDKNALHCLQANASAVNKSAGNTLNFTIRKGDALGTSLSGSLRYDIVFVDPPYALWQDKSEAILQLAHDRLSESQNARLIAEAPGGWQPPDVGGLAFIKRLGKGKEQPAAFIFSRNS